MRATLEDVCQKGSSNLMQKDIEGKTGAYPIYGASGLIGFVDFYHQAKSCVAVVKDGAGIGRTMLLPAYSSVIGTMQYLVPKDNVLPEYLYYVVSYMHLSKYFTGATIPHIYFKDYKKEKFNLHDKEEQTKIVDVLSRIERIIKGRRSELTALDSLIKAQFVEMFGDPVSNPKGWPMIQLGSRCDIITGNTPSRSEPENYGSYIEWIKSDNINTPYTKLTRAEEYLSEVGFSKCRYVDTGSILMTCIAGSVSCIGNVALVDRRVSFNQQINAIVPHGDEPLYLYYLIALSKPWIHRVINKSLKGILSKGQLSDMKFPFPPYELQCQFAKCAVQIDKSKFRCDTSRNLWKYAVKYIWDGLCREMVL